MNNNIYIIKYYVYIYITIERERKRDVMSMLMVVQQQNKQCDKIPQSLHSKSSTSEPKKIGHFGGDLPPW